MAGNQVTDKNHHIDVQVWLVKMHSWQKLVKVATMANPRIMVAAIGYTLHLKSAQQ